MKQYTKIETTEAVRRFNAQVELVDIALDGCSDPLYAPTDYDRMSPQRLHLQLLALGHADLAVCLREAGEAIGYSWHPDSPGECPVSERKYETKSPIPLWQQIEQIGKQAESGKTCAHSKAIPTDDSHFAWKCMDCGYIFGSQYNLTVPHWRTYQEMARQLDEMRTTLKQCRSVLRACFYSTALDSAGEVLKRIYSIIPPSEI